jgi:rubredoxin
MVDKLAHVKGGALTHREFYMVNAHECPYCEGVKLELSDTSPMLKDERTGLIPTIWACPKCGMVASFDAFHFLIFIGKPNGN